MPVQLPLDADNAATRKKAIAQLQAMLGPQRAGQAGSKQAPDEDFSRTALSRLTAGELVQLYDWPAFASQTTNIPWWAPGCCTRLCKCIQETHRNPFISVSGRRTFLSSIKHV